MNELAKVAKMVGGNRSEVGLAATTGPDSTPCVAFQIASGRCQILRQKWFTTRFADADKGRYPAGNVAMGITEAIQHCTSEGVTNACYREDDSHGHWGACSSTKVGEAGYNILSDCNYFSSVYYRDPGCVGAACDFTFPPPTNHSNATYHKLVDLGDADAGGFFNATNTEFSFNVSFVDDRGRRGALTAPMRATTPPWRGRGTRWRAAARASRRTTTRTARAPSSVSTVRWSRPRWTR